MKSIHEDTWREARRKQTILNHCYVVCRDTEKEALDYVRYYVDRMHEFQFAFAVRQLVGYERFAFDENVQREMLLPVIAGPLAAVEAASGS